MIPDPERVAARIAEVAQAVIAPRYGRLKADEIRQKGGPNDLVTEVDEAAERALEAALGELAPGAAFLGEELAARDPARVGALLAQERCWIVDPLDGTRNFINRIDEFGTIVAFVEGGITRMGWIYAIPHDACAIASAGEGATLDGDAIGVAPPKPRLEGLRSLGWLEPKRQDRIRARLRAHFPTRPGNCSAYAYLDLARGRVDFKLSSRIHAWDHAAGALLVAETGGRTAFLDGGAAYAPSASVDAPLLCSAAGRDWNAIAAKLRD